MENYLREIFERKKEQISKYVLSVYDKSGELFGEMEKEVFLDFRKNDFSNTQQVDEFLVDEVENLCSKADKFYFDLDYKEAIFSYLKAFLFTYFVEARNREPGYLFEVASLIFYKMAKIFTLLKNIDFEFYSEYVSMFDGYDSEYGALTNAAYFAYHFFAVSGKGGVERVLNKIKDVDFDYTGAFKMGLMMYIRLNIINHNFDVVIQALNDCDYKLINDNMYMGTSVNRISERFLVLFVNVLILNNRQEFVRKILEKNVLIRDCYEILLLNYQQNKN